MRTDLGPGPWQSEPDREEWRSSDGYRCVIQRNEITGALCGYVALPDGHPWQGRALFDVPAIIHGGCTFSGVAWGEHPELWWVGFDCGHFFDVQPGLMATVRAVLGEEMAQMPDAEYRTIGYVRAEVESLAKQVRLAAELRAFIRTEVEA